MKFTRKKPTTDKQLRLELESNGWKKIREPRNFMATVLLSLPFAFLLSILTICITYWLSPFTYSFFKEDSLSIEITFNLSIVIYICFIFVFLLIHELLHAVFIPNFMKSDKTFLGINGLFGFVYTTEKIKKSKFIIISIMPYFLLSIILPCILNLLGLLNGYTIFLCLLNAAGSCVDVLNICLILQVPNGAVIINNGFETYYKVILVSTPLVP